MRQTLCFTPDSKVHGPTWGPPGSCRPKKGPILAPWTLLWGTVLYPHTLWTMPTTMNPEAHPHIFHMKWPTANMPLKVRIKSAWISYDICMYMRRSCSVPATLMRISWEGCLNFTCTLSGHTKIVWTSCLWKYLKYFIKTLCILNSYETHLHCIRNAHELYVCKFPYKLH